MNYVLTKFLNLAMYIVEAPILGQDPINNL